MKNLCGGNDYLKAAVDEIQWIEEARKEVAETAPCQYSVEELEHRLGESVQSYRKGDCCTSDELRKKHPVRR